MTAVHLDIESPRRLRVAFDYNFADVKAVKSLDGHKFVRKSYERYWTLPLEMQTCRNLRRLFGERIVMTPELRSWAFRAKQEEERLGALAMANSGRLERLPKVLPGLYLALYLGPNYKNATHELGYSDEQIDWASRLFSAVTGVDFWDGDHGSYQTADVRFMADSPAPGNFNHQGLGKTLEAIGMVWEAGLEDGCHLVITPSAAVEAVWGEELVHWQKDANKSVEVFPCTGPRRQREATLKAFQRSTADVRWLIVNPQMIMWRKDPENKAPHCIPAKPKHADIACTCGDIIDPHWHYGTSYPVIDNTVWSNIINDETHKGGNVRNHRSISAKSINNIKSMEGGKRCAMSGTPMKRYGADIWGTLHYLRPDVFTSYWRFANNYFDVSSNGFGLEVGFMREGVEDDFFALLSQYALRRTKKEALPFLPDKQHVDVWVTLEGRQLAQYKSMELEGFALMGTDKVSVTAVLDEMTRLTQFARTYCEVRSGGVVPTLTSVKLDAMFQKLDEAGILDGSTDEQTLIFSESRKMIELVHDHLNGMSALTGKVGMITGANVKERRQQVRDFQSGHLKIMCVVTTAGGVALTLDKADTAHFLDEPWSPDDQEQAEDRAHRGSRMHQVTIYHYRAHQTIDEYRQQVSSEKKTIHQYILDIRREILKKRSAK